MSKRSHHLLVATSLAALCLAATPPARADIAVHDEGASDPRQVINITVHLAPAADFRRAVDALYDHASPRFHKWMDDAELARYAPPAAQREAVRDALERGGLTILSADRNGFSIRARGTLGAVQAAFGTTIHDFTRNGNRFRANTHSPALAGVPAGAISSVGGLESHTVRPALSRAVDLATGKPLAGVPLSVAEAGGGLRSIVTPRSLSRPETLTFSQANPPVKAVYSGITYDKNPQLAVDFDAKPLQEAYGLPAAYAKGLDGTGQTVVLLEAYGYPTAEADANTSAKLNKLPKLDGSNFKVTYPQGRPIDHRIGILTGWDGEIALDIQSAHSIAPGANILVVASNGQDSEDFQAAMQSIIDGNLGTTVSDSWEEDQDISAGPQEQESFEDILVQAAAKGISFQFSTGDGGDGGINTPLGAPGVPAVCPHAVAVGGTSILTFPGKPGYTPTGWGTSYTVLANANGPVDPPAPTFFGGGGGGESIFWPKPAWQSALPGAGRQTPDISALGDPYTGFPIVITEDRQQMIEPGIGGTSLSSPIFTAFWALAQQKAGGALGQASPIIAGLTSGVTDVLAVTSPHNAHGTITDSNGTTRYPTRKLFAGENPDHESYVAALWQPAPDVALALTFGLDTSLTAGPGWDNLTGYGTPDGLAFIDAAAAAGGQ